MTESFEVGAAYLSLVAELRRVVGVEIHEAWVIAPLTDDAGMNIPAVAEKLGALTAFKERYLLEVSDHLSFWPRWLRRAGRWLRGWLAKQSRRENEDD
jgi:hypothetical protein